MWLWIIFCAVVVIGAVVFYFQVLSGRELETPGPVEVFRRHNQKVKAVAEVAVEEAMKAVEKGKAEKGEFKLFLALMFQRGYIAGSSEEVDLQPTLWLLVSHKGGKLSVEIQFARIKGFSRLETEAMLVGGEMLGILGKKGVSAQMSDRPSQCPKVSGRGVYME